LEIPDHILFKNQKYDPKIGIFGMDVSITMERAGYRVKRRIAPDIYQRDIKSKRRYNAVFQKAI